MPQRDWWSRYFGRLQSEIRRSFPTRDDGREQDDSVRYRSVYDVVVAGISCPDCLLPIDFAQAYPNLSDDEQMLIKNLSLFLTNFLSIHLRLVESKEHQELLINAHFYLCKISSVDDREIFKITLEYWQKVGLPNGRVEAS